MHTTGRAAATPTSTSDLAGDGKASSGASPPPRCYALVPCAGIGERAGAGQPKQYVQLVGQSVVAHALSALAGVPRLTATLVVLAQGDRHFEQAVPGWGVGLGAAREWTARVGGASRAVSVDNGLAELQRRGAADHDWVLVHDAARCLLRPADVEGLIAACEADPVGGLLALPLADTLKRALDAPAAATVPPGVPAALGGSSVAAPSFGADPSTATAARVATTIDRRGLWQAQTPQMFRLGRLRDALAAVSGTVTDEAGAIEALGDAPRLVPGPLENFKLTWPADFALAERLLRTRA